jgi:hypothetical protein
MTVLFVDESSLRGLSGTGDTVYVFVNQFWSGLGALTPEKAHKVENLCS